MVQGVASCLKRMCMTWCGSPDPENRFQGCKLIYSDSVSPQKCSVLQVAARKCYLWPYLALCDFGTVDRRWLIFVL